MSKSWYSTPTKKKSKTVYTSATASEWPDPERDEALEALKGLTINQLYGKISELNTGIDSIRDHMGNGADKLKVLGGKETWTGRKLTSKEADLLIWLTAKTRSDSGHGGGGLFKRLCNLAQAERKDVVNVDQLFDEQVLPELWIGVKQASVALNRLMTFSFSSRTAKFPFIHQGLQAHLVADNALKPQENVELQTLDYTSKTLASFANLSIEALDDSPARILDGIVRAALQEIGAMIDREVFTVGGLTRTRNMGGDSMHDAAATKIDVAGTEPSLAELWTGIGALTAAQRSRAIFFMSPGLWSKIQGITTTSGMPIWQPSLSVNNFIGNLLGYPCQLVDSMPDGADPGYTAGTKIPWVYLTIPDTYPVGVRQAAKYETSRDYRFQHDQLSVRITGRYALPKWPTNVADRTPMSNGIVCWQKVY